MVKFGEQIALCCHNYETNNRAGVVVKRAACSPSTSIFPVWIQLKSSVWFSQLFETNEKEAGYGPFKYET